MNDFIGQSKIKEFLSNLTIDNCPQSILLVGEKGCGKHLVCNEFSKKLKIDCMDITDNLSLDLITDIYLNPFPTIFIIDFNKLSVKQENSLLKLLEEPINGCYVIVLCTSTAVVLPTILNRCRIIRFQPYTTSELMNFVSETTDDLKFIFEVADTPGKVIDLSINIKDMVLFSKKIIDKLSVASFGNILNISEKLAFKSEQDKFDYDYFCEVFRRVLRNEIVLDNNKNANIIYDLFNECYSANRVARVNKQYIFEQFLFKSKLKLAEV